MSVKNPESGVVYFNYIKGQMKRREKDEGHCSIPRQLFKRAGGKYPDARGRTGGFGSIWLFPEQTVATLTEKLKAEIDQTEDGEEILFVSDLFHGSPFNAIVSLMEHHDIYHVTGINLPLMVEVMMGRYAGKNAAEICAGLIEAAPGTVKDVRKLFEEVDEE